MTPAEQAERARLVAAVEDAEQALDYCREDIQRLEDAVRALASFDAAHKGEG